MLLQTAGIDAKATWQLRALTDQNFFDGVRVRTCRPPGKGNSKRRFEKKSGKNTKERKTKGNHGE